MPAPRTKTEIGLYITPDVLRLTQYSMNTRVIYAEVLSLSASGQTCKPNNGHFLRRFGMSADTVNRGLKELENDGLLLIEQDVQTGHNRTLTLPHFAEGGCRKMRRGVPQNAAGGCRKMRQYEEYNKKSTEKNTPPYPRAASRRVGGTDFSREEKHDAEAGAPAAPSPSTTPPPATLGAGASPTPAAATASPAAATASPAAPVPDHFAAFWQVWPTRQRRKDAATAFAQLPPDDQHHAATRAQQWLARHPRQVARGAVPFPARWLRDEMWTDGPEPPDRSPKPGQPPPVATTARIKRRLNSDDLR